MPRFEKREEQSEQTLFWEGERVDATLLLAWNNRAGRVVRATKRYDDEDTARYELGKLLRKKQRRGFVQVGPPRDLTLPSPPHPPGSALLVTEYFETGDPRLLDELLHLDSAAKLASLAEPWYRDARPFARAALLAYIADGCDRPQHKALVKRLLKLAETAHDDEVMAHFLVAFDRIARRMLGVVGHQWLPEQRTTQEVIGLRGEPGITPRLAKEKQDPRSSSPRFTRLTRRYLMRRAFRYFRLLGHRDIARYGRAIRAALILYRDEHLSSSARLLDAWGLMHALYGYSPVLDKDSRGLRLKAGASLKELAPAPYFREAWVGVLPELLLLVSTAPSRTVRAWALALLRASYREELRTLPLTDIKRLVLSAHEEVAALGAELLPDAPDLETLPITEWLTLLAIEHLDVVTTVSECVRKHVTPARLSLAQCIELACAKAAPVAVLGFTWANAKPVRTEADLHAIVAIAKSTVAVVRRDGAAWCASLLKTLPAAKPVHVRDLCDAAHADARAAGLGCLTEIDRFKNEPWLWFALAESPYEDVREVVIRHARQWNETADPAVLAHVWTSALLAVHRGGLAKRRACSQIADRIVRHPVEADALLPVLGLALRSVRPQERVLAIASLARAVVEDEALRALSQRYLPELVFGARVTS